MCGGDFLIKATPFRGGALARKHDGRLPKRVIFGKLERGEDPGLGHPTKHWLNWLEDDFKALKPRTVGRKTADVRLGSLPPC